MQLEEKRIPFRVERINMRCYGDKPAWFERATGGLLPVVKIDGELVTDSVNIMSVVTDRHNHEMKCCGHFLCCYSTVLNLMRKKVT